MEMKTENNEEEPSSTISDCDEDKSAKIDLDIASLLSLPQQVVIGKLVQLQEEFDSLSEEDFRKLSPYTTGDSDEDMDKRFFHICSITTQMSHLAGEFSKRIPGFDTLLHEDQTILLRVGSNETTMLKTSRKYDFETDSIVYVKGRPYSRKMYHSASMGKVADGIFDFCRKMYFLGVDDAEYALLTAIVIFSERKGLIEPKKVEKIQEFYVDIIKSYVDFRRPTGHSCFARLLSTLTELRTVISMNSELCFINSSLPKNKLEATAVFALKE